LRPGTGVASKIEKGGILDELCATTGWHRNHARKALAQVGKPRVVRERAPWAPLYGPEVMVGPSRARHSATPRSAAVTRSSRLAQTGQLLMSRLRGGSAGAARGAKSFLTETVSRVRHAGATGQLTVRADSAFYSKTVIETATKFDVRFSITARQDKGIRAAIDLVDESAWQPIPYWLSTPEVSGADIAETPFTVFARDSKHARQVRLVVRRVRPTPGSQLALCAPGGGVGAVVLVGGTGGCARSAGRRGRRPGGAGID